MNLSVALLLAFTLAAAPPEVPPPGTRLSLAEALEAATLDSPDVQEAASRASSAEAAVRSSASLLPTTLSVGGGQTDPLWSAGLTQRFEAWGVRSARVEATRREAEAARLELEQARRAARSQVRRTFAALVAAQRSVRLSEQTLELARLTEDAAREQLKVGAAPEADLVQAQAARAVVEAQADVRQGERSARQAEVALLLGRSPLEPLWGEESPPARLPPLPTLLASSEESPAAAALVAQARSARARLEGARAERLPAPTLGVSVEKDRGGNAPGVRASLDLEFPLLGMNRGAVALASAQLAQAELARELARRKRVADPVAAYRRAEAQLAAAARYQTDILPAAAHAEALAREAYRAGRNPLVQLLEAQRTAAEARLSAIQAEADAQAALADLEERAGVNLETP
ncbi:TolC family protein [Cystobacter fuscus]